METSTKPKYTVVKEERKDKRKEIKGVVLKYYETSQNECTNKSKGSILNFTKKKKTNKQIGYLHTSFTTFLYICHFDDCCP